MKITMPRVSVSMESALFAITKEIYGRHTLYFFTDAEYDTARTMLLKYYTPALLKLVETELASKRNHFVDISYAATEGSEPLFRICNSLGLSPLAYGLLYNLTITAYDHQRWVERNR